MEGDGDVRYTSIQSESSDDDECEVDDDAIRQAIPSGYVLSGVTALTGYRTTDTYVLGEQYCAVSNRRPEESDSDSDSSSSYAVEGGEERGQVQQQQEQQEQQKNNNGSSEDINEQFQRCVSSMMVALQGSASTTTTTNKDSRRVSLRARSELDALGCCEELERVARDFYSKATLYARVIITEKSLPAERRTIQPLEIGGVLGGQKYRVGDILFKFGDAKPFSSYAEPLHIAHKIQGHEMKGLQVYFADFFNQGLLGQVSFPMMALIDYRGHRITAMAFLPIEKRDTLVYGTNNAGKECNVALSNATLTRLVSESSARLNLREHSVVNGRDPASGLPTGSARISSCIDLEGHQGNDGRLYLLDYSRALPPAFKVRDRAKDQGDTLWMYYHMLRAEFVASYREPLSPDAFSAFPIPGDEENMCRQHIKEATQEMQTACVARLARSFVELADRTPNKEKPRELDVINLSKVMHSYGLNMRYLGLLYDSLLTSNFRTNLSNLLSLIQVEALSRVLKNRLRQEWRSTDGTESKLMQVAAQVLNTFFRRHTQNWIAENDYIEQALVGTFHFSATSARLTMDACRVERPLNVGNLVTCTQVSITWATLQSLTKSVGLCIRDIEDFMSDGKGLRGARSFDSPVIFRDLDFSFTERIKQLDVVDRARCMAQYLRAIKCFAPPANALLAFQEFKRAYVMIDAAMASAPMDRWFSWLMGEVSLALWQMLKDRAADLDAEERRQMEGWAKTARESFKQATLRGGATAQALYGYSVCLLLHGDPEGAIEQLEKASKVGNVSAEWLAKCADLRDVATQVVDNLRSSESLRMSTKTGKVGSRPASELRLSDGSAGSSLSVSTTVSLGGSASGDSSPTTPPKKKKERWWRTLKRGSNKAPSPTSDPSPPDPNKK